MDKGISNWKDGTKEKANIQPGTVTCSAKARISPKRGISKLLSSWIILRQLFKLEVEQVLGTNLFCKVITLVVCNVIANECNRHWSRGKIRLTRVQACNYTGELHAFMDEVGMGTFISSGGHVAISWPSRVTRVQQKGWCRPCTSLLLSTAFKREVWKMKTDFVSSSVVLPWGNKVQWYFEAFTDVRREPQRVWFY